MLCHVEDVSIVWQITVRTPLYKFAVHIQICLFVVMLSLRQHFFEQTDNLYNFGRHTNLLIHEIHHKTFGKGNVVNSKRDVVSSGLRSSKKREETICERAMKVLEAEPMYARSFCSILLQSPWSLGIIVLDLSGFPMLRSTLLACVVQCK